MEHHLISEIVIQSHAFFTNGHISALWVKIPAENVMGTLVVQDIQINGHDSLVRDLCSSFSPLFASCK